MTGPEQGQNVEARLPWRHRPRRTVWDVQPARLILALLTFPAMAVGVLAYELHEGKRHDGYFQLVLFFLITVAEAVYVVLWLRRPVRAPRS